MSGRFTQAPKRNWLRGLFCWLLGHTNAYNDAHDWRICVHCTREQVWSERAAQLGMSPWIDNTPQEAKP